ncbi:MAG: hypothetical protein R3B13_12935 [Polyangiaceae bacterium]
MTTSSANLVLDARGLPLFTPPFFAMLSKAVFTMARIAVVVPGGVKGTQWRGRDGPTWLQPEPAIPPIDRLIRFRLSWNRQDLVEKNGATFSAPRAK